MTIHHSTNNGVTTACGASVSGLQASRIWRGVTCALCNATLRAERQAPFAPSKGPGVTLVESSQQPYVQQHGRAPRISDATPEQLDAAAAVDMTDFQDELRKRQLHNATVARLRGYGGAWPDVVPTHAVEYVWEPCLRDARCRSYAGHVGNCDKPTDRYA